MKLGLAIAMRREALGMSQIELAKAVGVSKASVSRWESGDISNMRRDRIYRLAKALNVSPIDLLYDDINEFTDYSEAVAKDLKSLLGDNPVKEEIAQKLDLKPQLRRIYSAILRQLLESGLWIVSILLHIVKSLCEGWIVPLEHLLEQCVRITGVSYHADHLTDLLDRKAVLSVQELKNLRNCHLRPSPPIA